MKRAGLGTAVGWAALVLVACGAPGAPPAAAPSVVAPATASAGAAGDAPSGSSLPRLQPQRSHTDAIEAIAVSRDGLIVTAGRDEQVLLWDARTRLLLGQLGRVQSGVHRVVWDEASRRALTFVGGTEKVRALAPDGTASPMPAADDAEPLARIPGDGATWLAERYGQLVALDAKLARAYALQTPSPLGLLAKAGVSETGTWVVAAFQKGAALWPTNLRGAGAVAIPVEGDAQAAAVSEKAGLVLVASTAASKAVASTVSLADPGGPARKLEGLDSVASVDAAFSPDGAIAVVAGFDDLVAWDARSGKRLWRHQVREWSHRWTFGQFPDSFSRIAFTPEGQLIVGTGGGALYEVDATEGQLVGAFGAPALPLLEGQFGGPGSFVAARADGFVEWRLDEARVAASAKLDVPRPFIGVADEHTLRVASTAFAPCPQGQSPLVVSTWKDLAPPAPPAPPPGSMQVPGMPSTMLLRPASWGWPPADPVTLYCLPEAGPVAWDGRTGTVVTRERVRHGAHHVRRLSDGADTTLDDSGDDDLGVMRLSPRGTYVLGARLLMGGWLSMWRASDGRNVLHKKALVDQTGELVRMAIPGIGELAMSDDESQLAVAWQKHVHVLEVPSMSERWSVDVAEPASALAFGHGAQPTLYVGTASGGLSAVDATGHAGAVMRGSDAAVTGVRVDPRDGLVVTMHADGSLRAWRAGSPASLVLLASDGQWVVASDDGYFDASPHGGSLLAAVEGTRAYPIDQLAARNNRPDLLLGRMGLGTPDVLDHYRARHEQRLRRLGLTEESLAASFASAPRARIRSMSREGKVVTLDLELSAELAHLTAYNVYVDGVPLYGARGKPVSGASDHRQEQVELTTGRNAIEVSAFDDRGRESLRAMRVVDYAPATQPDLYYLGFGVSRYAHPAYDLHYAHKDALDLGEVLQEMGGGGFGRVHVMTRVDQQVTVEAIRGAKAFLAAARPDDVVVLFVGGHGLHARDAAASYFYATYETDVAHLDRTAASFESIEDLLQEIRPRRKLFLMDTCESGDKDDGEEEALRKRRSFLVDRDRFIEDDLARRSGAIVFSSSAGAERSYELRSLRNGVFTKSILRALLSPAADADHDGMVSVRELRAFVSAAVPPLTDGRQHPTVDRDNLQIDFAFPIVKSAKGVAVLDREDAQPATLSPATPGASPSATGGVAPTRMPSGCGCREASGGEAWPFGIAGALAAVVLAATRRATRRSGSVRP
jgi:outer membrane protein assembly factor BamB